MSILINKNSKILIQGITGKEGRKATKQMMDYGTNIICGVTPGKGGLRVYKKKVYNTISSAMKQHKGINTSVVYVPPLLAMNACIEALSNGIKLVVCGSEGIPIYDVLKVIKIAKQMKAIFIGPSSIGIISPSVGKIGNVGGEFNESFRKGNIGVISKSGGMVNEIANLLKNQGFGCSTAVGIGGDLVIGTDFVDLIKLFEKDKQTKLIIIYGEVGGTYENQISELELKKPIIAYVSGKFLETLPRTSIGHAGAIIEGKETTWKSKVNVLKKSGVKIANVFHEIGFEVQKLNKERNLKLK